MKIALVTDEFHPINDFVHQWLIARDIECVLFGSYITKTDASWVEAITGAAQAVSQGKCEEGIFFCWSGTGASIVANKTKGLRAALCTDPETVRLARIWNHANVLVLSNRLLTPESAELILETWFSSYDQEIGKQGTLALQELDKY